MIKKLLATIMLSFTFLHLQAQPNIEWQKVYGGTHQDEAYSIQQTTDGGYIVAGQTSSTDGDVIGNHGEIDYWVLKLTNTGAVSWKKCLGGTKSDRAYAVQQTTDGGYIIGGYSKSNNGDASGNHGGSDIWIVKLNSTGDLDWQKMLGGTSDDWFASLQQTTDGGYIVLGSTESNNGDVTGNHGDADMWLIKLNDTGAISWQKTFGGTDYDEGKFVRQTADSGYIIAGFTASNDGDITGNHGDYDAWIAKLNSAGTIEWQKCLGGTLSDEAICIQQTNDGGFITSIRSTSSDGDFDINRGIYDSWIVKMDNTGAVEWKNHMGGAKVDMMEYLQQTADGGYIAAGYSESVDGDLAGLNIGDFDFWIVKLSSSGTLAWQKNIGSNFADFAYAIQQTDDDGFIIAGAMSYPIGGEPTGYGGYDFGIVKLAMPTGIKDMEVNTTFHIYPNPAKDVLFIKSDRSIFGSNYTVFNIIGQEVLSGKIIKENTFLDIKNLNSGAYFINVKNVEGLFNSFKILKN